MQRAFYILQDFTFVILVFIIPFWFAIRGGSLITAFGMCWGLMLFVFIAYEILIPFLIGLFDRQMAKEVQLHWVPEMTVGAVILVLGWLPALILVALAGVTRVIARLFWPNLLPAPKTFRERFAAFRCRLRTIYDWIDRIGPRMHDE
jgi:hypothetical protein